ncbi:MAG: L,D-transpeptidase family protein, partial [Anaerolineae bacterium]|nr:L,D-transpeptidase family protein [Anaerolineae bacterium]
ARAMPVPTRAINPRAMNPRPVNPGAVRAAPRPVVPPPQARPKPRRPAPTPRQQRESRLYWGLIVPALGIGVLVISTLLVLGLMAGLVITGRVLPGVAVGGVALGGMSEADAAQTLAAAWNPVTLRDGDRAWTVDPAVLGLAVDAQASAAQAYAQGRGSGGLLDALFGGVDVPPVVQLDTAQARAALLELAPQFELAAVNAGVRLVDGRVEPTPPREGRALDPDATLAAWQSGSAAWRGGSLALVMLRIAPAVTDSAPLVAAAERLLQSDLQIRLYDPVTGDNAYWSVPPAQWSAWLVATPDGGSSTGLALTLEAAPARQYVEAQAAAQLDPARYLDADAVVASLQQAVSAGQAAGYARVYHHDRQHIVQYGETITTIAWDYGVPYPWIEAANPGVGALFVGQSITIPTPDNFLEFEVVPDKRIEVSISEQRVRVYENGALRWDWPASTGIASSPTWPGVYQIISHEINAYAGNWNLWMPNFMGVYRPIPGADFTNGFHGFPTRGGSQILWTNSLGTRVTYGCILISDTNAQTLYDWAEEGVVVEILP